MTHTTLRVTTQTRDIVAQVAANHGISYDQAINKMYDTHWQAQCIEQSDRWREDAPEEWRRDLVGAADDDGAYADLITEEGPYDHLEDAA